MGHGAFVPFSYASASGAARICQGGGAKRGRVWEGVPPPTVGRFLKIRV